MAADSPTLDVASIDVFSSDVYLRGIPHEQLAWLRAQPGLVRQAIPDPQLEDQAFIAARYADVVAVATDSEHFTITDGHNVRLVRGRGDQVNLLTQDDPAHLRLRLMANRAFTPKVVRRYEQHYRELAGAIVEGALAATSATGEPFDFVTDVSARLPLAAICELLDAPAEDHERIFAWSNAIIGTEDGEYSTGAEGRLAAFVAMSGYVDRLVETRQARPADDLLSRLAAERSAGRLTSDELYGYVMLLFVAGNETTRNNISHGLAALLDHPDQLDALRRAPAGDRLWDTAVEEITRWATPVVYMSRTCTAPVTISGTRIEPGDIVAMLYPSANRDEAVFGPTASRFDITRNPNPHLSFGFSTHLCMGSHLARLETKMLFQELLGRVGRIEAAGEPVHLRSSFIHGMKHLPVRAWPAA